MSAAVDRLVAGYYNSLPRTGANPGGLANNGHVTNFPAALVDVGVATNETGVAAVQTAELKEDVVGLKDVVVTLKDDVIALLTLASAASEAAQQSAADALAAAQGIISTSTTMLTLGLGARSLVVQTAELYQSGQRITGSVIGDPATYFYALVDEYDTVTGELDFTILDFEGAGSFDDWDVSLSGIRGPQGIQGPTGAVPSGCIVMWSGSIASIPAGWVLCDGGNGTRDLRGLFIVGAGGAYAVGATGGAVSATPTITIGATTLSTAQMPAHTHPLVGFGPPYETTANANGAGPAGTLSTGSTGGGDSHTHTGSSSAVPTLPPYYALALIQKL